MWWPLDEAYYTGVITRFLDHSQEHRVVYEDGDTEFVQLWAPEQEVSACLCRPWMSQPQLSRCYELT